MEAPAGEWPSEVQDATAEIQNICDQVKVPAEGMAGIAQFPQFRAESYRQQQVVAGMNYRIKVYVGNLPDPDASRYWNLSVFQANGGALTVTGIEAIAIDM